MAEAGGRVGGGQRFVRGSALRRPTPGRRGQGRLCGGPGKQAGDSPGAWPRASAVRLFLFGGGGRGAQAAYCGQATGAPWRPLGGSDVAWDGEGRGRSGRRGAALRLRPSQSPWGWTPSCGGVGGPGGGCGGGGWGSPPRGGRSAL